MSRSPAFLSYAREDWELAAKLAQDLKARGVSVWLDQIDIPPGRRWDVEIQRALTECSNMLVILSPASVESHIVLDEITFALNKGKTVIPILQADVTIPLLLQRVNYIDFRHDYEFGFKRLLEVLTQDPVYSAVLELKRRTALLYSAIVDALRNEVRTGQAEIRNHTLRVIETKLKYLKEEGLLMYDFASRDLDIDTINRVDFQIVDKSVLQQVIERVESTR